jgi:hypothetical protein
MDSFLEFIGASVLVLMIAGHFEVIDFHVCIKPAGKCTVSHAPAQKVKP